MIQCPYCEGKREWLPPTRVVRTLPCRRCNQTGEVSVESEERRKRLCAMLRSDTIPSVAQRLQRMEHEVVRWSISQEEIPEGVV